MKAIVKLRAATLAFIHGKAPNLPEFRIPSLRGSLRYWTRALWGPYVKDPKGLHQLESALWGSTDRASAVVLRIDSDGLRNVRSCLLPHHAGGEPKIDRNGMSGTVSITINGPQTKIIEALAMLRVALALGGLGQRERRGAGSFAVESVDCNGASEELTRATPVEEKEMAAWIGRIIRIARDHRPVNGLQHQEGRAPFPMLCDHPRCCAISVKTVVAANEEETRAKLMRELRSFKGACWGLPYQRTTKPEDDQVLGRWSSPVHLRLLPGRTDGQWLTIATLMKSPFPDHVRTWDPVDRYFSQFGGIAAWPEGEHGRVQSRA